MRKFITFCCFILLASIAASAQQLKELIQQDTLVHVYKLNYEQSRMILKNKSIPDTSFLLTKKFRDYSLNRFRNDTLPEGNFLIARIYGETIYYEYYYNTPLSIQSKVINDEVILFLSDKKTNKPVQTARVEIEGLAVKYDAGTGGYTFLKKNIDREKLQKREVFVKISFQGEIYIYQYSIAEGSKPGKNPDYYSDRSAYLQSPGYLLLDKPMYKPLDSLNLKAYLVDFKTGKPIRKKAWLSISEPQQRFYFSKKIKRKTPGAYLFNWKLPDSLKMDRQYAVQVRYNRRGRTLIKNANFRLEEYELAKNQYTLDMPSEMFFAGDDIRFYTTASDMNGFPVQGTRVHYQLRIDELYELFTDTLTLSAARKQNWYENDTTIEYDKFIETKIPSALLPNANGKYTLEVTMTDPVSFEKKVFTKHFLKYVQKEKLLFYQQNDSLHIRNLYNNKDTSKGFLLITFKGKDTLSKRKIITPFHYHLDPLETAAMIVDKDSLQQTLPLHYHPLEITRIKGKRTGDSIMISFAYPFNEPVHYRIYKKDKVVKSGAVSKLNFTAADRSLDEYRIMLTSNLQGHIVQNFYELTFVPEKDILHFDKIIPASALPGDSIAIELVARDFKNQPRKKVNIAAYSLNAAFVDKIETPQIDVPEPYRNQVKAEPVSSRDQVYLSAENVKTNALIKNHHITWFNLRKNEYYQLKYPIGGVAEIYFKKQQPQPEFMIAITQRNQIYTPKYILLDGQPVFISDLHENRLNSIAAEPGLHQISFRFADKVYNFKEILLKPSSKLILGINADSAIHSVKLMSTKDSLPILEPTDDEKQLLYSTMLITNLYQSDSTEVVSDNLNQHRKYFQMYGTPRINIDGDYYFVDGPFTPHSVVKWKVNEKVFNLKTGIGQFYFYDDVLKDFVTKNMDPIKGAFLHFAESQTSVSSLIALLKADTLPNQPEIARLNYLPKTEKALQIREEENLFQNYHSSAAGEYFRLIFQNKSDSNFIRSAWIISAKRFESCDFIAQVDKPGFTFQKSNAAETYDLYLFYNRNRMVILRNMQFNGNDEFYINAAYLKPEAFTKEKIEVPLKIYAELNSTALLPFYDTPFEPKERIKMKGDHIRNNIYLHGMITNDAQEPLNGALVYVELNGKFKYGATTNENGLFELLDILPGTYQIKIMHPDYKFAHFAPFAFTEKKDYEINTSLQYKETTAPLFESVYNDFRLLAFARKPQKNIVKIRVYEKASREHLKDVQIKIFYHDTLISAYPLAGEEIEIPFPKKNEYLYTLEISKAGYTSLRIHDIQFQKNYLFYLDAFVGLERKELLKTKEYKIDMEGALPYIADAVAMGKDGIMSDSIEVVTVVGSLVDAAENRPLASSNTIVTKEQLKSMPAVATGDFVSMNGGYQRKSGDRGVSIGGDRSTGTTYLIDGIRVNSQNATDAPDDQEFLGWSGKSAKWGSPESGLQDKKQREIYADGEMIDQVIQNKNTSTVRKKFTDVGYWKPNLITDKNGRAAFTIKLPDNITAWKSYFVGMGNRWLHGIDSFNTRVYKPLQTTLLVPAYLYREDQLFAKIRFTNLTKDSLNIVSRVLVNGQQKLNKQNGIAHTLTDSVLIEARSEDTLRIEGGLTLKETYKDFEHYDIPVFSPAMKQYNNQSLLMEKDSTYVINIDAGSKGEIIFNNAIYEKIIAVVNELNQYEYACVEQSSSKLYGLLLKDRIQKKLQIKERVTKDIYSLLARLADMQNKNGSFGWWRNDGTHNRMTIYVMEITHQALTEGYINNVYDAAKNYVLQHFTAFSQSDQLYALQVLLDAGVRDAAPIALFRKMTTDFLNTTDRIYFYQIKYLLKDSVSKQDLNAILLDINQKATRPYYDNFFYDNRSDLFKAYSLFVRTPYADEFRRLFRKKLLNGQLEKNLNTFSKARMIEAMMSEWNGDSSKPVQANVVINDTLRVKYYPFRMHIRGDRYKIQHSGGDVFVNTAEEKWVNNPVVHDSVFGVRSYFIQNKQKSEQITAGTPCDFTIDLQVFRSAEQVMIEIPIPSGMKVVQKNKVYGAGNYVEYYKHKVVYFFDKLPMGTKQLVIQMMPVFKGECMLPAAKASLMYYPFVYGNNENRKVTIR